VWVRVPPPAQRLPLGSLCFYKILKILLQILAIFVQNSYLANGNDGVSMIYDTYDL